MDLLSITGTGSILVVTVLAVLYLVVYPDHRRLIQRNSGVSSKDTRDSWLTANQTSSYKDSFVTRSCKTLMDSGQGSCIHPDVDQMLTASTSMHNPSLPPNDTIPTTHPSETTTNLLNSKTEASLEPSMIPSPQPLTTPTASPRLNISLLSKATERRRSSPSTSTSTPNPSTSSSSVPSPRSNPPSNQNLCTPSAPQNQGDRVRQAVEKDELLESVVDTLRRQVYLQVRGVNGGGHGYMMRQRVQAYQARRRWVSANNGGGGRGAAGGVVVPRSSPLRMGFSAPAGQVE
ncbi:hypothetical protein BCR33DRAFT_57154 [Rhizoclosmatium globosum]|uniref:Uncharacterized protein n=1 Tax=Rhizoclosmatium globosum TaxID=329046 RepID=A0A1Y2CLX4_9FUNG|nr:hypothetical protein BCR33DRAFT_57154 [Rhizoclosmatium globosum]|eukprot:ORY48028.1 hypothetical protein BCR33DRAFT_57154 [Rhizoclosmatium globosum]